MLVVANEPAWAVAKTWRSAAGGNATNWNRAANWAPAGVPAVGDDVTIPTVPNNGTGFPVLNTSPTILSLAIQTGASVTGAAGQSLTVTGAVTGAGTLTGGASPITVGGNMTVNTLTSTSTVTYNGTGAQTIGGGVHSYTNLTINKASGTATFASNAQVAGNLSVTAGTLDLVTFTANRTAAGGTLTVGAGATLRIGGTNTFPANYNNPHALNATSTVEYSGAAQTVLAEAAPGYGHLILSGSGTKTMPAAALAVRGNFILAATGTASATLAANVTVGGDLTVSTNGGTLDLATFTANRSAAGGTITVSNNSLLKIGGTNPFPANYSAFALGATSTVEYSGTTQNVASAIGASGYGHLILSGTLTKTALGTFTVRGGLSITGVTFDSVATVQTVNGNVSNTGTHTATTGSITLSGGAAAHSLTGNGTYANLILNDANGATLGGSPTISGTLTLTSGTFAVGANTLTLNGPNTAGTTSNLSTTSTSTLVFGGSAAGVNVPSGVGQLLGLTVGNSNGITLASSPTANGTLTFTSGNLNTAANTLTIGPAPASILGAAAFQHVVGNLAKSFSAETAFTYAIGDGTNYTPLAVTFSAAVTGNLTASVTNTDHPNTTAITSGIDSSKSINRYWTLKASTISGTYDAALTYINGTPVDRDSGATAASFIIRRGATCSGTGGGRTCASWAPMTASPTPSNTLATATNVSITSGDPESDFVVGEVTSTRFTREKEFIYTRELY